MGASVPALAVEDLHESFGAVEVPKGVSMTAHKGRTEAEGAPQDMLGTPPSGRFEQFLAGTMD